MDVLVEAWLWITGATAALLTIVNLLKNAKFFQELFYKLYIFAKKCIFFRKNILRKKYNRIVSSKKYLSWKKEILNFIYNPLIEQYNNENSQKCNKVCICDTEYDAISFQSNAVDYPFTNVCEKEKLGDFNLDIETKKGKKKILYKKYKKIARKYYSIIKSSIPYPHNIGYMFDEMRFDNNHLSFSAHPSTYLANVLSSNVLEYELYLFYKKYKFNKKNTIDTNSETCKIKNNILFLNKDDPFASKKFILKKLPLREKIHQEFDFEKEHEIFIKGNGRDSLLGVQSMVLCKNQNGGYDVLRIRRSEKVDSRVGFIQFIPSGGFSALNNGLDCDTIVSNYSLPKAILRELLEECFGEEDFSGRKNISSESIYSDSIIKKLNLLSDTNKKQFQFIGSTFDLSNLRHDLCFLLVIDDFELIEKILNNEECENVIHFVPLDRLRTKEFWLYKSGQEEINDYENLNSTSAGLWNLVEECSLFKSIVEKLK